jgi:hypothetical protein
MQPGAFLDVGGDAAGFTFDFIHRYGDFQLVPATFN